MSENGLMTVPAAESGLIVVIGEAAEAVAEVRARFDSSAALDVPPHVTVLYPFLPPQEIDAAVIGRLTRLFAGQGAFGASFAGVGWFGEQVLWLAPDPSDGFRRLTELVAAEFPECPPYGGQYDEVVPHLTVADRGDADDLRSAERSLLGRLPVHARISSVSLLAQHEPDGPFSAVAEFPLG